MKKISAVLLVMVLVGSVAFAGFTGSATTEFGYNLDSKAYGFTNDESVTVDVNFLELVGESMGEGDVYADISATLNFTFSNADAGTVNSPDQMILDLDFDHAKIIGENWYVGILGATDAADFAASTFESTDDPQAANDLGYAVDDDTEYVDIDPADYVKNDEPGVAFGYNDFEVTVGASGVAGTSYDLFGSLSTPEFELGDGLTAKFAGAGFISDSAANAVSGSVMVAYEADEMSGSLAADLVYVNASVMTDVALTATYDAYTLDVYYATDATNGGYTATSNLLSAQVEGTIEDFTVTLAGLDLINTRELSATVDYMVSDELAVSVDGSYTLVGGAWSAGADATYTTDAYELAFGGSYASTQKVTLDASVESSSIVPGATLALAYAADDVTAVDAATEDDGNLGSITASVEIAF